MKLSLGIPKKTGSKTFCLTPRLKPATINLVLIEQLHGQGRLIGIGVARPSLINGSIGPILPKLRSPEEHLGELVGCRQCHLAERNVENRFGSCKALGPRRSFV